MAKTRNTIKVICEGKTEYNYLNGLKKFSDTNLLLDPIDCCGGGYASVLNKLKKTSPIGVVARFVLVDFDRFITQIDTTGFYDLLNYCKNENRKGNPTLLIVSNPDFDIFVLKYNSDFTNQDKNKYIKTKYKLSLEEFKAKKDIFDLVVKDNDYKTKPNLVNDKQLVVKNNFKFNKNNYKFSSIDIKYNENNGVHKLSNMKDLFSLL